MALLANSINSLSCRRGTPTRLLVHRCTYALPQANANFRSLGLKFLKRDRPVRMCLRPSFRMELADCFRHLALATVGPRSEITNSGQESTALAVLKTRNFRRRGLSPRVGALY